MFVYATLEFKHSHWPIEVTWQVFIPIRMLHFQCSVNLLRKYFYRIESRSPIFVFRESQKCWWWWNWSESSFFGDNRCQPRPRERSRRFGKLVFRRLVARIIGWRESRARCQQQQQKQQQQQQQQQQPRLSQAVDLIATQTAKRAVVATNPHQSDLYSIFYSIVKRRGVPGLVTPSMMQTLKMLNTGPLVNFWLEILGYTYGVWFTMVQRGSAELRMWNRRSMNAVL